METLCGSDQDGEVYPQKKESGVIMLKKATFDNNNDVNAFFAQHDNNGESTIYIIKCIILHNPIRQCQEQHYIYSDKQVMKNGMHLQKVKDR